MKKIEGEEEHDNLKNTEKNRCIITYFLPSPNFTSANYAFKKPLTCQRAEPAEEFKSSLQI